MKVNHGGDAAQECRDTSRVVGEASEDVETDRTCPSVIKDACKTKYSSTVTTDVFSTRTEDKDNLSFNNNNEVKVKQEPIINDMDTVYGTYDETTNCITIIYPGKEEDIEIQESVQEVTSDESAYSLPTHLSPAYTFADSMSPASVRSDDIDVVESVGKLDSLSDGGYESHGSPSIEISNSNAVEPLTDLWHESFSELFPSLA